MYIIGEIVLLAWIPIIIVIFASLPPRRAALTSTIVGWLFLPRISYELPGIPEFGKISATTIGVVIGLILFDRPGIARFRLRWYDLPMIAWCAGTFFTSVANNLGAYGGAYDGASQMFRTLLVWGFPYFVGRICLEGLEGIKEAALAVVIGGLAYAPLCLWEIRMSPSLHRYLYGIQPDYEIPRFGLGYRPILFLTNGLEVGMWMAAASLCAYWLWRTKTVRELKGFPFGQVVILLIGTSVLGKSVGANLLLAFGIFLLESVRLTNRVWPILLLAALPPTYVTSRTFGLWSGAEVIQLTDRFMSERTQSVSLRIVSEDHLMKRAFERPILGWGGYNRCRIIDANGKDLFPTDGFWIIELGQFGIVGLVSSTLFYLLPTLLTCRRFPGRTWSHPTVSSVGVLGTLIGLYMVDNLSNATASSIYTMLVGGLMGLENIDLRDWKSHATSLLAMADSSREAGDFDSAREIYLEALKIYESRVSGFESDPDALAEFAYGHEAVATTFPAERISEAQKHLALALKAREAVALLQPEDALTLQQLAISYENLGRFLSTENRASEAEWARTRAIQLYQSLAAEFPQRSEFQRHLADSQNDLAWLLVTARESRPHAIVHATLLAKNAVSLFPSEALFWNTLGAATYYAGEFSESVEALTHSVELGGGTGFDLYYLAMANARLNSNDAAISAFALAESWSRDHLDAHVDLARLRAEAAMVLGV